MVDITTPASCPVRGVLRKVYVTSTRLVVVFPAVKLETVAVLKVEVPVRVIPVILLTFRELIDAVPAVRLEIVAVLNVESADVAGGGYALLLILETRKLLVLNSAVATIVDAKIEFVVTELLFIFAGATTVDK